jgi:hypothetical protein
MDGWLPYRLIMQCKNKLLYRRAKNCYLAKFRVVEGATCYLLLHSLKLHLSNFQNGKIPEGRRNQNLDNSSEMKAKVRSAEREAWLQNHLVNCSQQSNTLKPAEVPHSSHVEWRCWKVKPKVWRFMCQICSQANRLIWKYKLTIQLRQKSCGLESNNNKTTKFGTFTSLSTGFRVWKLIRLPSSCKATWHTRLNSESIKCFTETAIIMKLMIFWHMSQ